MKKNNWEEILLYVDENKENKTIKEMAEELGVHHVTLSNRYGGYVLGKSSNGEVNANDKLLLKRELNIKKEMNKLTQQRVMINKEIRKEAFYERFVDEYVIPEILPLKDNKKLDVVNDYDDTFILLTDLHYIDHERSYDDVMQIERMLVNNHKDDKHVNIIFMGDLIEGSKHLSSQIAKTTSVMDQIIEVSKYISEAIVNASRKLKKTQFDLYFLQGNHEYANMVGARNRDDSKENYTHIIKDLIKSHLKDTSVIIMEQKTLDDLIIGNKHFQHGDRVRGDFRAHMKVRKEQQKEMFKDVNYFFKGHSHRQELITGKGEDLHFINVPCLKTWIGEWEVDNNQIGTNGAVILRGDSVLFIR